MSAVAQKLSESLKKQIWFPVFSLEKKTTFWAGSQFYVEVWPALRKGSGWSYSQSTLNTIGTRGGKKNYENGDYYDDDDDDDDYDDDEDDDDVYNMFSKHRPSGPMLSISQNVRLSVCLSARPSVCSLVRYRLTVFLPPLPKVGCQIFFRDLESLGKSNGKKWSNIWTFLFESCLKSPRKKSLFFLLILPYKTWWKPRFLMD